MSKRSLAIAAAGVGGGDPNFKNVSLLLSGDNTNGAQNNTFLDSSTNNFTITRNGNTTQGTFSPYGNLWSNYFDGSTGNFSIAYNDAFAFGTGDFTVEGWFYFTDTGTTQRGLVALGDGANGSGPVYNSWSLLYRGSEGSNQLAFYRFDGTEYMYLTSGATISANTWTHIAVCRGSGTLKIFVNGTAYYSAANSLNFSAVNTNPLRVALQYYGPQSGYTGPRYWPGNISNLRIVKGTALYTSNFTPSTTPLTAVSGTSLLTCQSNRFKDNSSNNFTLTVNGNTSVQRFSPFNPTAAYSAGTVGGSGYFDGTGDYLSFSNISAIGDFTYEVWIYPTTVAQQYQQIVYGPSLNGSNIFQLLINYSTLYLWANLSHQNAVIPNQWQHVALVRQSGTIYLYLNGVKSTGSISNTTTATINRIGSTSAGIEQFNGYQSNARFVAGTAVYTASFTPPTAPLTAITNTSLLCNFTNAGIPDAAMQNDLETVGNAQVSTSVKKYGTGSLAFDGTGDYLVSPANAVYAFGTGDFTIEAWIYPQSSADYAGVICQNYTTAEDSWTFCLGTNGIIKFQTYYTVIAISPNNAITQNTWQHVAVTRSGTTVRVFVNGTIVGTGTSSLNFNLVTGIRLGYSGVSGDSYYTGYIDDARITKGVARYTANFTPPAQSLPKQ